MVCALFPGQGNQYTGMGSGLYEKSDIARKIYDTASEISGKDLKRISFSGTVEEQRKTENLQLITFVNSVALYELCKDSFDFDYMVGHSIGEYSALYSAEVFGLEDAVKIISERSELMSKFSFKQTTLVAVLGIDDKSLENLCFDRDVEIALHNCPGNHVVGGFPHYIEKFCKKLKEENIRFVPLQVSGPFHTSVYKYVCGDFLNFLERFEFDSPKATVLSNLNAMPYTLENIVPNLANQICNPVLFEQSIAKVPSEEFVEIGPGKSLSNMVERIKKDATIKAINKIEDIEKY